MEKILGQVCQPLPDPALQLAACHAIVTRCIRPIRGGDFISRGSEVPAIDHPRHQSVDRSDDGASGLEDLRLQEDQL
jgi:hypothetical protein